ncbi:NmrA/HSCARG family protein [Halomarina halobia]|uniref:NmrA/HSCARG family protein n=1 Tax=Halomarina halobia TaxID=3033386 RepID=A0ABD6ADG6_9EURY|nr:NmrA/HSCARG family protein [Halomarina sp. PSR21]
MKRILVAGATGFQGGAVVDHLLSGEYGEYEVFGLTRDAHGEAARALSARGVHVVEGDMRDDAEMGPLAEGMDGVYCVTTYFEDGVAAEIEQGETLATAAAAAGVPYFVLSSVAGADRDTGLEHFESKYAVERHVRDLDLAATVIRPVYFMQNVERMREEVLGGRLALPLEIETRLDLVDVSDVGRLVASAFADPDRFVGASIDLAGDARTLSELAEAVAAVLGRSVTAVHLPVEEYRAIAGDELADTYAWFNEHGYGIDVDALVPEYGFTPRTFEEYLRASDVWSPPPRSAS